MIHYTIGVFKTKSKSGGAVCVINNKTQEIAHIYNLNTYWNVKIKMPFHIWFYRKFYNTIVVEEIE